MTFEDKIFNLFLTRIQSRGNATLSISAMVSAASLIILGFYYNNSGNPSVPYWEIFSMGILFPSIGFAYNEITKKAIHKHDNDQVNKILQEEDSVKYKKFENNIKFIEYRPWRIFLFRFLLLIPILGWLFTLPYQIDNCNVSCNVLIHLLSLALVLVISICIALCDKIR